MNFNLTLIGQMISFAVFVWFTMTYVWTPIVKALETARRRSPRVSRPRSAAIRKRASASSAPLRSCNGAKAQATEILSQAQKRAGEIVEESKVDARSEGQRLIAAAQAEIERETNRAREELREKVATLAVAAAEKILKKEIDAARPPVARRRLRQTDLRGPPWPEKSPPSRGPMPRRSSSAPRRPARSTDGRDALAMLAAIACAIRTWRPDRQPEYARASGSAT